MITVANMTISRTGGTNSSRPILRGISCVLPKGTVTLIAGQTGSGKSTFLNAVAGLIPLESGSVSYDGLPLWIGSRLNNAVKFKTSILFQYPERQLFAESIRKEFAYSLRPLRLSKPEKAARINEAMSLMNLPERLLDESFYTLSDGWKRKVATSATIAAKPEWLLLDEPTAGIDPQSIPLLLDVIGKHIREQNGGVIVVSHDLDTFLPIADRILVMQDGALAADMTPEELYSDPDILSKARIGLPASVEIPQIMASSGIRLAGAPLTPAGTADAIFRRIQERCPVNISCKEGAAHTDKENRGKQPESSQYKREAYCTAATEHGNARLTASTAAASPAAAAKLYAGPQQVKKTAAEQLHPIAKWLLYLLLSSGILIQDQWLGTGVAALITSLCIFISGAPYRTIIKPAKPFLYFILISALISGLTLSFYPDSLRLQHAGFHWASAAQTTLQLSEFLLIMLLGMLFAVTTSPQTMQRALEQALSLFERFRVPVAAFTFAASLLFRFIPMLFAEFERISLITRARGKSHVKPGSIRLRDARVFMIPLVLSMMKNAEDLAFVLEARGYKMKRLSRSAYQKIHLDRQDWLAIGAGVLFFAVLILLDRA